VTAVHVEPAAEQVTGDLAAYLRPTETIDFEHPDVRALAGRLAKGSDDSVEVARKCFEWVRDTIQHCIDFGRDELTCAASDVLREGTGFCYAKSHLLVALLRANGLPAGLCYQRLVGNAQRGTFVLHGLAAVRLPAHGWYRVDPRGNKAGVDARFTPPVERLAFPIETEGEVLFPGVYADAVPSVVATLRRSGGVRDVRGRLPDVRTVAELEAG
jgi:transglutaminase-like putative cysteine protease